MGQGCGRGAATALWTAVDALTKPTKRRMDRVEAGEWLEELANVGQGSFCRVEDYRAAMLAYGEIPALWDQAEWSLVTGRSPTLRAAPAASANGHRPT
jgi:hypothetical protein